MERPVIGVADLLIFVDDALTAQVDIVTGLGDDLANRRPGPPGANSPYAILNHCLGVLEQWGAESIADRPFARDRGGEFHASGPVAELAARARAARRQLDADLAVFAGDAAPNGPIDDEDRDRPLGRSQGGVLVHIYEELAQHLGQLELTRDLLLATAAAAGAVSDAVGAAADSGSMTGFALPVDAEIDLVLREEWTWPVMHRLTLANLDHLAPWEAWASDFPPYDGFAQRCRAQLVAWTEGTDIPTAIRYRGELVGSLGARPNVYFKSADIGYWLDAAHQGKGIITRAAAAMIDYLFTARGVARIELQTMTANAASRALAERLGFALEGIRHSAFAVAGARHDAAVYGLLRPDAAPRRPGV